MASPLSVLQFPIIAHAHTCDAALQKQWSSSEFPNYHVHVNA